MKFFRIELSAIFKNKIKKIKNKKTIYLFFLFIVIVVEVKSVRYFVTFQK